MYQSIIPKILEKYQLDYSRILDVQKGYRNESYPVVLKGGKIINVICYKRDPDILNKIDRADSLALAASEKGLPIRVRYDNRILKITDGKYAAVYNYLPGETIAWEAYTKKHIKLLGWALGSFHAATKHYGKPLPSVSQQYIEIMKRVERYFSDDSVLAAARRKLKIQPNFNFDSITTLLERSDKLTDQQPLHMDLVRGNILFRKATEADDFTIGSVTMSGIIDLEKSAYGHRLFDIARTAAFLLVDCPKPADKILKYLIDSGYRKRGQVAIEPVSIDDTDLLEQLISIFLIYDFYKFLKQNPYESLADNHHYSRTASLLIKRNLLISL